jgi:hypothetical protein
MWKICTNIYIVKDENKYGSRDGDTRSLDNIPEIRNTGYFRCHHVERYVEPICTTLSPDRPVLTKRGGKIHKAS